MSNTSDFKNTLTLVQNFYIEFFGTLIPGIIAVGSVLALAFGFFFFATDNGDMSKTLFRMAFQSWGGGMAFFTVSYVIGAITYRRSPRKPDTISAYRQWRMTQGMASKEEADRLAVIFNDTRAAPRGIWDKICYWINREQWILHRAGTNVDYPYPRMKKYLCCRGLHHLAHYVPWCAGSGGLAFKEHFGKSICSKTYVNIIKQRLREANHENLLLDMVRTECHIRMLCSLWYIFSFVLQVLLASMALAVAFYIMCGLSIVEMGENTHKQQYGAGTNVYLRVETYTRLNTNPNQNAGLKAAPFEDNPIVVDSNKESIPSMGGRQSPDSGIAARGDMHLSAKYSLINIGQYNNKAGIFWAHLERLGWYLFLTGLFVGLAAYCRRSIEQGLHYVRTREIVMLLESAWILDNVAHGDRVMRMVDKEISLFGDILKKGENFEAVHCNNGICKFWRECWPELR